MPPKGWRKNPDICRKCWPDGWPLNSGDAESSHGHWHRDIPEAEEEA